MFSRTFSIFLSFTAFFLLASGCATLNTDVRDWDQLDLSFSAPTYLNEKSKSPEFAPGEPLDNPSEITLGMSMAEVRTIWGQPYDIEIAGDSRLENQRWIYSDGVRSRFGMSSSKIIYFEQGKVAGWETR